MSDPRFPVRPDQPEFWTLAGIVTDMDVKLDTATDDDVRDARFTAAVGAIIPPPVAHYVSIQRAMRAAGIQTLGELEGSVHQVAKLAAAWLDGFIAGARYQQQRLQPPNARNPQEGGADV